MPKIKQHFFLYAVDIYDMLLLFFYFYLTWFEF